ncbi:hypothetical protein K3727_15450 [Rhodobacteraceae bacterium M382]|nr:hypothetical protein K3727_15450 [Rhodobacteraceae bacterium M382]
MKYFSFALALIASPVLAQDFSEGSTAKEWNLYAEQPALFEAKVVDLLCELTGDCPTDCGAGKRQLGLLRSADNVMVLPLKNGQAAFSGAAVDLAPYCGQTVEVDGLLIDDPDLNAKNIYMVQKVRVDGGEWSKTNQFTKVWAKENPEAKGKGPWFRRDPRIKEEIASEGYLGLGLEADTAFIKEWF